MPLVLLPPTLALPLLLLVVLLIIFSPQVSRVFMLSIPHILNMAVLSVPKITCPMIKSFYYGYVYLVSIGDKDYVVKANHLDEFVSLMHDNGAIVVNDFTNSKVVFDYVHQWYKAL